MTLANVLPFFLILAAGYAAVRFRYIPEAVADGLMQYVFLVAAPVFVFGTMLRSRVIDRSLDNLVELAVLYLVAAALAMAAAVVVARFAFKTDVKAQMQAGIAGSHGSVVVLGIPAALLIAKTQSVSALAFLVGLHGFMMAVIVLGARAALGQAKNLQAGKIGLEYALSPVFIGFAAGFILGKLDIKLGAEIDALLRAIAVTAAPCALFAFGGWMVKYKPDLSSAALQRAGSVATVKLLLHPLLFWLLATKLKLFSVPGSWIAMAVIVSALPAGFELFARGKRSSASPPDDAVMPISAAGVVTITVIVALMS